MSSPNSAGRVFTFVDYDINRRGVTDTARAHLMKDRVRTKREARSEWATRNQYSPLRWMRPKEDKHQPNPGTPAAKSSNSDESDELARSRISHYAAVIDFQHDSVTVAPFVGTPRSRSPRTKSQKSHRRHLRLQDNSSESSLSDRRGGLSPEETSPIDISRWIDRPVNIADSPRANAATLECERPILKQRRTSTESRSEFGLALLDGIRIPNASPAQRHPESGSALQKQSHRTVLTILNESVARSLILLSPVDHNLLGYFAVHAVSMLGLDRFPDIVQSHDPVLKLFLPFAVSTQWCLETMVLFFGAKYYRRNDPAVELDLLGAEDHYLASRQNLILARTRERISALARCKDSTDGDVVAFLFLALAEYCTGHREIGLMHFKAWKEYCEMRRCLGVQPCGLPCKTIVWWCISIMCEDDVALDGIINPATRARVREDPGKLFRYFETINDAKFVDAAHVPRPEPSDRQISYWRGGSTENCPPSA